MKGLQKNYYRLLLNPIQICPNIIITWLTLAFIIKRNERNDSTHPLNEDVPLSQHQLGSLVVAEAVGT